MPVLAVFTMVCMLLPQEARLAVNPELFREHSPEWLTILILESTASREGPIETINLRARVVSVERSAAGLKPGDEIDIVYSRDDRELAKVRAWHEEMERKKWAGEPPDHAPAPPRVGATVRAYLASTPRSAGPVFHPDAHHHSFE